MLALNLSLLLYHPEVNRFPHLHDFFRILANPSSTHGQKGLDQSLIDIFKEILHDGLIPLACEGMPRVETKRWRSRNAETWEAPN